MPSIGSAASTTRGLRVALMLVIPMAGAGCSLLEAPILDPGGPVALAERDVLFRAFGIMMIVVIPVFVLTAWFAWRYRASNTRARYERDWNSEWVDAVTWVIPALIVISVAVHVWIYTHRLDPYRPLADGGPTMQVQVVAQDWKWLFIYPELGIAAVNELAFPSDRQLALTITSDTVMNAFSVPALGGQIYAMAGMRTQLHLTADAPGSFTGRNTQYSGDGFARQHFAVRAMTDAEFEDWVAQARSESRLDAMAYQELAEPSIAHPVTYYAEPEAGLFEKIIAKYHRSGTMHPTGAAAR